MPNVNFVAVMCITVDFGRHNCACQTFWNTKFQGEKHFVIKEYFFILQLLFAYFMGILRFGSCHTTCIYNNMYRFLKELSC